MKRKRNERTWSYWREVVAEYERSSQTQEVFTQARRLNVWTFRKWLYRVRDERKKHVAKQPARLVEVKVAGSGRPSVQSAVRIRASNGIMLEFDDVPTPSYLAAVVSELSGAEQ